MQQTYSATPLQRILIEPCADALASHVWLRKNIVEDTADDGPDGDHFSFYMADEVHFMTPGTPSVEAIERQFDEMWNQAEKDERGTDQRLDDTEVAISDVAMAVAELGMMIAGGEKIG